MKFQLQIVSTSELREKFPPEEEVLAADQNPLLLLWQLMGMQSQQRSVLEIGRC